MRGPTILALAVLGGSSCHGVTPPISPSSSSGATTSVSVASGPCSGQITKTGLQVWLDASNLNVGDGGSVATWNDCHNSALAAVQAVAANQPIYSAAGGPDNSPYVAFDGVHGFLSLDGTQLDFSAGITVFLLANLNAINNGRDVLDRTGYDNNSSTYNGFSFSLSTLAANGLNFATEFAGTGYGDGGSYSPGVWHLANFVYEANASQMFEYEDGAPAATDSVPAYSTSTIDLKIFGRKPGFRARRHRRKASWLS